LVYFKFEKKDEEPGFGVNNQKAEEYRIKFEEGDPNYYGNVYDVNGCHLYELVNSGKKEKDKDGGVTIPVETSRKPCIDSSWELVRDLVNSWHKVAGNPHYFTSIIFYDIYGDKTPNGYTVMTRADKYNECYTVLGD